MKFTLLLFHNKLNFRVPSYCFRFMGLIFSFLLLFFFFLHFICQINLTLLWLFRADDNFQCLSGCRDGVKMPDIQGPCNWTLGRGKSHKPEPN